MKIIWTLILSLLVSTAALAEEKKLILSTCPEYIPQSVLKKFTDETGIQVTYASAAGNEAIYAKLKVMGKQSEYDLLIISTYFVSKMRNEGMLQKLDLSKIANKSNIDSKFLNRPYDPHNQYSLPYLWGTTGIVYNSKYVTDKVDSWQILFDPKYRNKIFMPEDIRDVFLIALSLLNHSGSTTDPEQIKQAYEKLKDLSPNVKVWGSESFKSNFVNEDVILGVGWSGFAHQAVSENPALRFVYPKEHFTLWIDNLVIPKYSRNVEGAHKFIEFVHRPEISKIICQELGFATPNQAAYQLLPAEVRNNQIIYPPQDVLARGELQEDVGKTIALYEQYWEKLKAGFKNDKKAG